ncbi:MAG: DnaD domain protein [Eubacteriales bacterium]|jgi:DnaD/phage-associated family protein
MGFLTIKDSRLASVTLVSDDFIDYYLPKADGEYVKVYLYLLRSIHRNNSEPTLAKIAADLSLDEGEVTKALRYWSDQGLLNLSVTEKKHLLSGIEFLPVNQHPEDAGERETGSAQKQPEEPKEKAKTEAVAPAAQEKPAASAERPTGPSNTRIRQLCEDKKVEEMLYVVEQYIGRPLSPTDMRTILYFYDSLHFPVDLVEYLVEYCADKGHPNVNYIRKVGLAWYDEGIRTTEQAKAQSEINNRYFTIFSRFGISGRNPIPDEINRMKKWLDDYGFSMDLIQEAASRTIAQTSKPSLRYADKILTEWHKAGVRTLDDVDRLDREHEKNKVNKTKSSGAAPSRKDPRSFSGNFHERDYNFSDLEKQLLSSQNKAENSQDKKKD